jgi:hypothetical protein
MPDWPGMSAYRQNAALLSSPRVSTDARMNEIAVTLATLRDVDDIVTLLQKNEAPHGSLTGHFTHEGIEAGLKTMPVILARLEGQLVGALVSAPVDSARTRPAVARMLAAYGGGPDAYVYGPICVADAVRGRGVARMLFDRLRSELPGREGILFIRRDNAASLRAHERLPGMQVRGEFSADGAGFVVLSF